jgi:hypothetical protein
MSINSLPVIKFMFREEFKALNDALRMSPPAEVGEQSSSTALANHLATIPAGLVIASLKTRDDLIQIASFVKIGKKVAKDCTIKIVVINFSGEKNYEKAVAKLGILDLVEPNVNMKALKYKLDFWMKSLAAQAKLNSGSLSKDKIVKAAEAKQGSEKKKELSAPEWIAPLDLEDDIWLIKNEAEVKKILGKWLIRLLGPSPYVGNWYELKPDLWRFDIKETEKPMLVPNEGSWFFSGDQKPDFVWKENNWLISGDGFELFFKSKAGVQTRLKSHEKVLTVCKNSLFAKTKEQVIIESFDKELVFKNEAERLGNMEGENQTEVLARKNLEGKNKTEQLDYGNLKGRSKQGGEKSENLEGKNKTDHYDHENLEQKLQKEERNELGLQGNFESDSLNSDLLEQKANNKKEKTFWNGKVKYDKDGNAEFGLDTAGENNLSSPDLEAPLSDQDVEKYYKNHNEVKNDESLPKGPLNRKSQTDEIPTHYNDSEKERKIKQKETSSEDLYGKTKSADKLKTHYGTKGDGDKGEDRPHPQSELSGKGVTDQIEGHYSGGKEKDSKKREGKEPDEIIKLEKKAKSEKEQKDSTKSERTEKDLKEGQQRDLAEIDRLEKEMKKNPSQETEKALKEAKARAEKAQTEIESFATKEKSNEAPGSIDNVTHFRKSRNKKGGSDQDDIDDIFARDLESNSERSKDDITGIFEGRKKDVNKTPDDFTDDDLVNKANNEKAKEDNIIALSEAGLDEISQDAKVTCFINTKGRKIPCELSDYFDETIIFLSKEKGIENSAKVVLDLSFKLMKKDNKLSLDGIVTSVDGDGEGNQYVTIQLSKENMPSFEVFMKLYESRQSNVTEFLKRAKGY